jgi:hypothetical protein
MLAGLVAFTSANNEQIKDAEQIGINVYSWNDFLKMVGKENLQYSFTIQTAKIGSNVCDIMYVLIKPSIPVLHFRERINQLNLVLRNQMIHAPSCTQVEQVGNPKVLC